MMAQGLSKAISIKHNHRGRKRKTMTQCSLAYTDPCSECAQYGNRSPSQAVRRLNDLEMMLQELKG